ncbi:MAG: polysaccharide deacetylase family protein [Rhodospirillales bacterium]
MESELDAWADRGRAASFWWRDDDAVSQSPALSRLLGIASDNDTGIAIAVIPTGAGDELLDGQAWPRGARLLQHGLSHRNHAPAGEKKAEFGPHRPLETMIKDIRSGIDRLGSASRFFAAFVPPWNRISPEVVGRLAELGHRGVSTHGPRRARHPFPGLVQSNTHVDPIDWRGGRGYVGDEVVLDQVISHLRARRDCRVDEHEPTGLLTHHLVHDSDCWAFIDRFVRLIRQHAGAAWLDVEEVFAA